MGRSFNARRYASKIPPICAIKKIPMVIIKAKKLMKGLAVVDEDGNEAIYRENAAMWIKASNTSMKENIDTQMSSPTMITRTLLFVYPIHFNVAISVLR